MNQQFDSGRGARRLQPARSELAARGPFGSRNRYVFLTFSFESLRRIFPPSEKLTGAGT